MLEERKKGDLTVKVVCLSIGVAVLLIVIVARGSGLQKIARG